MAKRMLIDAAHPEETRVVVLSGNRLEEFDFESSTKKQVKGNIYLAKVTRVEPSLQAAFVDYGGNRHGFLAFSEVHPDYYRIPVSDRDSGEAEGHGLPTGSPTDSGADENGVPLAAALPEPVALPETSTEDDEAAAEESSPDRAPNTAAMDETRPEPHGGDRPVASEPSQSFAPEGSADNAHWRPWEPFRPEPQPFEGAQEQPREETARQDRGESATALAEPATHSAHADPDHQTQAESPTWRPAEFGAGSETVALRAAEESFVAAEIGDLEPPEGEAGQDHSRAADAEVDYFDGGETERVEYIGGDEVEEVEEADAERRRSHPMRHYKIQEVIKRRQIMLVQVSKEERGNKGAALTTYLSLAGRYCVLMPNTARGGGVSRKITSLSDRRRLKEILAELDIPEGMGVIVRTAGAERTKAEIKRDYEYLLRLWNEIRELTLKSTAPALIYEEGSLIKRAIRDLYTRDIDEVQVEGEEGYRVAKAFMRTLMPSHAKRVQPYRDPQVSLFHRFQVESQIDAIHSPVAQLRSGGYVVINQTEALVAIDVNSGRSTRERNIEETALRTNLEAADEIGRQLRLRDLAGLIVIDFIDMEEHRNQGAVERRVKEALKNDRARIQVGRISAFGLLEMSRQRLRPSLVETSTQPCPHCGGTGSIRSTESTALYVLRSIEEEGMRRRSAEICVYVPTTVALYILNQKRDSLVQLEARYAIRVLVAQDDALIPPAFRLERLRHYGYGEAPPVRPIQAPTSPDYDDEDEDEIEREDSEAEFEAATDARAPEAARVTAEAQMADEAAAAGDSGDGEPDRPADDERGRRRRRRRRRRDEPRETRHAGSQGGSQGGAQGGSQNGSQDEQEGAEADGSGHLEQAEAAREGDSEAERRRRRRGRRGGRLRPRHDEHQEEYAS